MRTSSPRRPRLPSESANDAAVAANRVELAGTLQERGPLRHTPAGIPVIEFQIAHESEQLEAGSVRRVVCEIAAMALGPTALLVKELAPGSVVRASGFLAMRSLKRKTPVLHVTHIEFIENFRRDIENGFQTQQQKEG